MNRVTFESKEMVVREVKKRLFLYSSVSVLWRAVGLAVFGKKTKCRLFLCYNLLGLWRF